MAKVGSGKELQSRQAPKNVTRNRITVTLPTFVILVLRHRAEHRHISVSAIIEPLILDDILINEVERLMNQSPEFARVAIDWMRNAPPRKNR
jgi:hypothetical protein